MSKTFKLIIYFIIFEIMLLVLVSVGFYLFSKTLLFAKYIGTGGDISSSIGAAIAGTLVVSLPSGIDALVKAIKKEKELDKIKQKKA